MCICMPIMYTYGTFLVLALSRTLPFSSQPASPSQDHTADMSAVRNSRHVCWGPQRTCLLRNTADMSAV